LIAGSDYWQCYLHGGNEIGRLRTRIQNGVSRLSVHQPHLITSKTCNQASPALPVTKNRSLLFCAAPIARSQPVHPAQVAQDLKIQALHAASISQTFHVQTWTRLCSFDKTVAFCNAAAVLRRLVQLPASCPSEYVTITRVLCRFAVSPPDASV